jgi:seryl-tRNA synthetase
MGLIRKTASLSTLGAVKYTSRREAQTKAALEDARMVKAQRRALDAQAKLAEAQRKALSGRIGAAEAEQREQAAEGQPWYRQPTIGAAVRACRESKKDDHRQEPESMSASAGEDEA